MPPCECPRRGAHGHSHASVGRTRTPPTPALTTVPGRWTRKRTAPETAVRAYSAQGRNHSFPGLLAARDSPAPPPPPPCARPRRTPRPPPPVSPRSAPGPRSFPGRLARTSRAGDGAGARGLRSRLSAAGGRAPSCGSSGRRRWPGGGGPCWVAESGGAGAAAGGPRESLQAAWRGCGPGGAPGSGCWRCPRWASA